MAEEIERKFKLVSDEWRALSIASLKIQQGYLQSGVKADQASSVRIRIEETDLNQIKATINIKSAEMSVHRTEYEYSIPISDASAMLETLCDKPILLKTRFLVPYGEHLWELDVFEGDNAGLEIAEVELKNINEKVKLPHWIGQEVSDDPRYYNNYLLERPYRFWGS